MTPPRPLIARRSQTSGHGENPDIIDPIPHCAACDAMARRAPSRFTHALNA